MKLKIIFYTGFLFLSAPASAFALTFDLPKAGDNIVGFVRHVHSMPGDNFSRIGRRYDVGYYELVEANPDINPEQIEPGTEIIMPTQFILPAAPYTGIVINLAELRLYYYPPGKHQVITMPVGIGSEGWSTPTGLTHVTAKVKDPTWVVPESIRLDRLKDGVELPKSIPPGPDNPLGGYKLNLELPGYRVHGAKQSDIEGIGRRSSHGCIRLFPEDIERLFTFANKGLAVNIINEPNKIGWLKGELYLESHLPLETQLSNYTHNLAPVMKLIQNAQKVRAVNVNQDAVKEVVDIQDGIPTVIGVTDTP